jgi:prepilin peptidase CpaA
MNGTQFLLLSAVLVTIAAAWFDHKRGQIPNGLTYLFALFGALVHVLEPDSISPGESYGLVVFESFSGALTCACIPYLLWRSYAMGGGDVKLLAALGATLGPGMGLSLQLYAFVIVVLVVPIIFKRSNSLIQNTKRSFSLMFRPLGGGKIEAKDETAGMTQVHFGPAILLGTMLVAVFEWK